MKSVVLKTGEVAYILTESEKHIFRIALRQFNNALPLIAEGEDA